jgi:hypothetical protein
VCFDFGEKMKFQKIGEKKNSGTAKNASQKKIG